MRLAPVPQQGTNLGDAIREQTQRIVDNALAGARREMEDKLGELRAERAGLQEAASNMRGPGRLSLQSRIDRLDRDILQLEEALAKVGRTVVTDVRTPEPRVFASTRPAQGFGAGGFPPNNFDPTPVVATSLGILFVAFPLTLAIVRFIWKRSTSAPTPAITAEQQRRFDRIEQSVDAIAIEVERISENQRYLTKILSSSREHSQLP
jgi:hypothetical protein